MTDDDFPATDDTASEFDPTARGIAQCLRMLAEEAQAIGMPQTLDALRAALQVCSAESTMAKTREQAPHLGRPPGTLLH